MSRREDDRQNAIAQIRAYADWLEAHPDVDAPTDIDMNVHHHRAEISPEASLAAAVHLVDAYGARKNSAGGNNKWVSFKPGGDLIDHTLFVASEPTEDIW